MNYALNKYENVKERKILYGTEIENFFEPCWDCLAILTFIYKLYITFVCIQLFSSHLFKYVTVAVAFCIIFFNGIRKATFCLAI